MPPDHFRGIGRHGFKWELGGGLGCLDAVWFGDDFGSIQLKSIMQRLAVLAYIELMQRAALIRYCKALKKVLLVEVVNQSMVLHLS